MLRIAERVLAGGFTASLVVFLGACTGATSALDPAGLKQDAAAISAEDPQDEKSVTIITQPGTVSQKGTYIRVLVNGDPITNYDIQRRKKFRQLRRLKATDEETIQELVDERIKVQEARKRGMLASDDQVAVAFANFAKGNKSTPERVGGDLERIGVGATHFKEFIRGQMSWSRVAGAKLQSETQSKTQSEAIFELRKAGEQKPETTEYILQQIVFVIPDDKLKTLTKVRMGEALAFRQRYAGCDKAVEMAKGLHDVAVKDLGRKMQPELPPKWADEVSKLSEGQLTPPQATEQGVEMLGVCRSRVTSDDRAAQVLNQAKEYDSLAEKGNAAADSYLAELRKSATIIYR